MDESTIAAIATPPGNGGIGIIRISGNRALTIASAVFRRKGSSSFKPGAGNNLSGIRSHRLYYGHVLDPITGVPVDEAMAVYMKGPKSYTAEDVVEIQAHAGSYVLRRILDLVLRMGAELAGPGDFTKRAFLNGRLDLTQAEAVIDIINARTHTALEIALEQVRGGITERVVEIRTVLMRILTEIEAVIDFPDDVGDILDPDRMTEEMLDSVLLPVKELVDRYDNAHFLRDGLKLAIVGPPNAGKSSLMNLLVNRDRSIVTPVPGTTRDLIEDSFNLAGIPFVITDTAGLHDTEDPVEVIGIKKAEEHIDSSDIILYVVEAGTGLSGRDMETLSRLEGKKTVFVINKVDIVGDDYRMDLPEDVEGLPTSYISVLNGTGVDQLKEAITGISMAEMETGLSSVVPNLRHRNGLQRVFDVVSSVVQGVAEDVPFELLAIDIGDAVESLGEIIGDTAKPDILDNIFSNFCIGK